MTKIILVIIWVMMLCNLAGSCQGFGGNCCNLLPNGASRFFWKSGCCLWHYGVLQPRRLQSLYWPQWNLKSYDQNYFTVIIILKCSITIIWIYEKNNRILVAYWLLKQSWTKLAILLLDALTCCNDI